MIRLILAQLRHRVSRSAALLAGVLVATTGFTILTGSIATAQLRVTSEVNSNIRGAYDILVRPHGSRTPIEASRNLVGPNYLSGTFGGITMQQYATIGKVDGVEVAAPIANLGYVPTLRFYSVDLTALVNRDLDRQLLRLDPTWTADRGLTAVPDKPQYVYVTKHPLTLVANGCGVNGLAEVMPDRHQALLCGTGDEDSSFHAFQLRPDGTFLYGDELSTPAIVEKTAKELKISLPWWSVVGAAAVDPVPEARLVGVDKAVTTGRYLTAQDSFTDGPDQTDVPVLMTNETYVDESPSVTMRRQDSVATAIPGADPSTLRDQLAAAESIPEKRLDVPIINPLPITATRGTGFLNVLLQGGLPQYATDPDGALRAIGHDGDPTGWTSYIHSDGSDRPANLSDVAFRPLTSIVQPTAPTVGRWVGIFDPAKLADFADLARTPLETYQAPEATGADAATRKLLGDKPLRPASNPQGYLVSPPLMLMNLASLPVILGPEQADRAISSVRVRVSDVHSLDDPTRERIRRIAEDIQQQTGLDVDITIGSSLSPQTIVLPQGKFGRPELRLNELWSKKGVAVAIITAIDRKSAILFGLILVVCVLFLGNAAIAAARDRRQELAVLACLGWPGRRLAALIAGEVALLAVLGGLGAAVLTWPLSRLAGIEVSWRHAALAVPVALLVALAAAIIPAVQAARAHPGEALAPKVTPLRRRTRSRRIRARSVVGLALGNAGRRPGRTLLGVAVIAFGVGTLTPVATLTWVFHGQVTGSLLGDAVSVKIRPVDTLAVAATLLLAALALADVLYLNVRERAAELATLLATGWGEGAVTRLIVYEGLLLGLVGAMAGAGLGLALVDALVGEISGYALGLALAAAATGLALAAPAVLLPALSVRRLPLRTLLAEE